MTTMLLWTMLAGAAELDLDDVLSALDPRLPAWDEAQAERDAAQGKALASRGAFDPKVSGKVGQYVEEDYTRTLTDAYLSAASLWGPSAAVGHRLGDGKFPTYDGRETSPSGELYAQLTVPLADGLWFSPARIDRDMALALAQSKEAVFGAKQVALRFKASEVYWKWVAAGRGLEVELQQLELAEQRASMLDRQVEEGSRAALDALDNERVLYERREALIAAQQKLDVAAVELSLWWRDEQGRPQRPLVSQLPEGWPERPVEHPLERDLEAAARRPDVRAAEALIAGAERQRQGASNALLPSVDVGAELSQDVQGGPAEALASVTVSTPLLLRKERGSLQAAGAMLRQQEASLRGLRDRAVADVLAAHAVRDTSQQRVEATRMAAVRAEEVVVLERRRYELGGGDLFQLLQRETNLAKARKAAVDAELALRLAEAAVVAATGQ